MRNTIQKVEVDEIFLLYLFDDPKIIIITLCTKTFLNDYLTL